MKILQHQVKQADFIRTVWAVKPEPGTSLEDMLAPDYWANVAKTLKAGDRIEITAADNSWFAELLVRSTSALTATLAVLRHTDFASAKQSPAAGAVEYDVRHRGSAGWSVVRLADKAIVFEKGDTREQADAWVKANALG